MMNITGPRRRLLIGFLQWLAAGLALISAYMFRLDNFDAWNWFHVFQGAIAHASAGLVALGRFFNIDLDLAIPDKKPAVQPDFDAFDDVPVKAGNGFVFGAASEKHLLQSYRELAKVHRTALRISDIDFALYESKRSVEKQRQNIKDGVSWTMESGHVQEPYAMAIDHVPWVDGKEDWSPEAFARSTAALKRAAEIEGVSCIHGFDWPGEKRDGPHTELDRRIYPYQQVQEDIVLT